MCRKPNITPTNTMTAAALLMLPISSMPGRHRQPARYLGENRSAYSRKTGTPTSSSLNPVSSTIGANVMWRNSISLLSAAGGVVAMPTELCTAVMATEASTSMENQATVPSM